MSKGNLELNRSGFGRLCYSSANAFLMVVPGVALLMFGEGKTLMLPESIIDFVFPFALLPPEKMLLVALTEKFKVLGEITFADFDRIDIFVQQFFVLSLFIPLLVIAILTVQACGGYLYPAPNHQRTILGFLRVLAVLFLLREAQVCLLVGKAPSGSQGAGAPFTRVVLHAIAPEFLIMFSCGIAIVMWIAGLHIYREISIRWD